jgi:Family of unknown function (DUF5519)
VHENGIVDIPFPRAVHDALLAEALAEEHHWVPDSGWTTFVVRNEEDFRHAWWVSRLSYLRYMGKKESQAAQPTDCDRCPPVSVFKASYLRTSD